MRAKIKLPVIGAVISPVSSTVDRGVVQVLGTGRHSALDAGWDNWAGAAPLSATIL